MEALYTLFGVDTTKAKLPATLSLLKAASDLAEVRRSFDGWEEAVNMLMDKPGVDANLNKLILRCERVEIVFGTSGLTLDDMPPDVRESISSSQTLQSDMSAALMSVAKQRCTDAISKANRISTFTVAGDSEDRTPWHNGVEQHRAKDVINAGKHTPVER